MFEVRRVLGMGCVFARVLLVGMLIMRVLFSGFAAGGRIRRGARCLDGCHIRQIGSEFRHLRLAGVSMVVLIMRMFMVVRMLMIFMIRIIMVLRIRMVMFGIVRVTVF